jgi:hypothetical protein
MKTLRKLAIAFVASALLAGAGISSAFADPIQGRNAISFNVTCGGEQFTVVSASEPAASIQVVGRTTTLVATDATLTTTYTNPQTGEPVTEIQSVVSGAGHGDATGVGRRLTTCTDTITVQDANVGLITTTLVGTFIFAPPS